MFGGGSLHAWPAEVMVCWGLDGDLWGLATVQFGDAHCQESGFLLLF